MKCRKIGGGLGSPRVGRLSLGPVEGHPVSRAVHINTNSDLKVGPL